MSRLFRFRLALSLLAALFFLRIIGQLLVRAFEPAALPGEQLWHSEAMPYPVLLILQLVVLLLMASAVARLGAMRRRPMLANALFVFGLLYLFAKIVRFAVGVSGLAPSTWFDVPIATAFHFVLAGWLLIFAYWLMDDASQARVRRAVRQATRLSAYPFVVAGAFSLFLWLERAGAPSAFAAYLPVTLGAAAILILELAAPYRRNWRPERKVVLQDALYLLLVQMLLPAGLILAATFIAASQFNGPDALGVWPHSLPVPVQAALMLILADLLRYWLHRIAHHWRPVWRLHAVHHAPETLYFLNVGRFHPLDKALQFLLDSAPFIILGVGPEVVSAYFVFYAINGFFQHSNVDVRLGPLNWIIAGPELHRWHHSRVIAESNSNYGNNLIVWDALFGTRFLPPRDVGALGLLNQRYPKDIVGQTLAPLLVDPGDVGNAAKRP